MKPIAAQSVGLQHLHPKVTARALGGIAIVWQPYPPGNPQTGDLWFDTGSSNQPNRWSGAAWEAVPLSAGELVGENFIVSAAGQFFYDSPPALTYQGFEAGLQGWAGTNATLVQSPAQASSGLYSALATFTSGSSWFASGPQVPAAAGTQVYASAWVYAPQALGAVQLVLAFYTSGGTLISLATGLPGALAAGVWTQVLVNGAAPASTAAVSVIVQDNETSTTGYQLFIDDVWLAGALAVSAAPSAVSDPLGNVTQQGVTAYGPNGTAASLYNDGTHAGILFAQTLSTTVTKSPFFYAQTQNLGAANENTELAISSGKESGNADAALQLFSEAADGSSLARAVIEFGGAVALQVAASSGGTQLLTPVQGSIHTTISPYYQASALNPGAVNEQLLSVVTSGKSSGNDDAALQLFSESADGTTAAKAVLEFGGAIVATFTRTGISLSSTAPLSADTWHNITLDTGWTSVVTPQYRLLPYGDIEVRGQASHAGVTTATNINGSNPLGSTYQPNATRVYRPPTPGDGAGTVEMTTTGVLVVRASGFTVTQVFLDGTYSI